MDNNKPVHIVKTFLLGGETFCGLRIKGLVTCLAGEAIRSTKEGKKALCRDCYRALRNEPGYVA